jgi:hypothetical protein
MASRLPLFSWHSEAECDNKKLNQFLALAKEEFLYSEENYY